MRVHPRDDIVRRDIKHPLGGRKFSAEGSTEWPNDQFTKRRISDGTVRLESAEESQARTETRAKERGGRQQSQREHGQKENGLKENASS